MNALCIRLIIEVNNYNLFVLFLNIVTSLDATPTAYKTGMKVN